MEDKTTTTELWMKFHGQYTYQYINSALNLLEKAGYMVKEKTNKEVYFSPTKELKRIVMENKTE